MAILTLAHIQPLWLHPEEEAGFVAVEDVLRAVGGEDCGEEASLPFIYGWLRGFSTNDLPLIAMTLFEPGQPTSVLQPKLV